jgi:hypothetical protein
MRSLDARTMPEAAAALINVRRVGAMIVSCCA